MGELRYIYRTPYGKCRTLGVFFLHKGDTCPTITSSAWDGNHFYVQITSEKHKTGKIQVNE